MPYGLKETIYLTPIEMKLANVYILWTEGVLISTNRSGDLALVARTATGEHKIIGDRT